MNKDIIFLTGFMGTGKSATGKELAKILERKFIDTDQLVEEMCGMDISDIFAKKGELSFRQIERDVLTLIKGKGPCVVSTGGGMAAYGDNLEVMKKIGTVVSLTAKPEEILRRVSSSGQVRPLLMCDDPLSKIISLLQKRAYYYINSHIMISTDGKEPIIVAVEIKDRLHL